ncbi:MAG: polyribonucleotide nucleotidyltransferase [Chloroflexi bacterium]|nr:polyribonucleotide nucleotidyltransferase [Chloroflexota bacterium]
MIQRVELQLAGRTISLETGKVACQADGSILARYGDTIVLATVVASKDPRPGQDFFPLTIDYEERLYAAGKIPGSRYVRREGRPTDEAILVCRLIDRPLRPLFPKGMRHDVQIVITTLSADQENPPDILGIVAASAAVSISDIPFNGPVGAVRMSLIDGQFVVNPTEQQLKQSELDLTVAGTKDAVIMVEAGADSVPEDVVLRAIQEAHRYIKELCELQEQFVTAAGKPKREFLLHGLPDGVKVQVEATLKSILPERLVFGDKAAMDAATASYKAALLEALPDLPPDQVTEAFESAYKRAVREQYLAQQVRLDGRSLDQIRPITCEAGLLPRTHGSGLFTRGQTQALTIVTLASGAEEQILRSLGPEETKRYIHQYNMPGFSTGEVKRVGNPGRREIGHGALAERALLSVIPPREQFPYTIRVVSEILSSNGSTSMASVCGSTLALMDAGVPIKSAVAGVAMGLITSDDNSRFVVLTDILGAEDALGDMDFKVAGTADGITALQMDLKAGGLPFDIMRDALARAREGRLFILQKMLDALPTPRSHMSPFAPRIITIKINPEKIGVVIGPGGKNIRKIQEETTSTIEIEDDGTINIATNDGAAAERAVSMIQAMTEDVEVGKEYVGTVKRIMDMGAFVEIIPGKEGLVRINQLANRFVEKVDDVVKIGDSLRVKVIGIDAQGRINLSHKVLLPDYVEPREGERLGPRESGGHGGRTSDGRRFMAGDSGGHRGERGSSSFRERPDRHGGGQENPPPGYHFTHRDDEG